MSKKRTKLRISHSATELDTYDITPGVSATFPLKYGSGTYTVAVYGQTQGNRYAMLWSEDFDVVLDNPDACFLCPNQYVNYTPDSDVAVLARRICEGKSEREAYNTICRYMTERFGYDFIKAIKKTGFMLPDIEGTMRTGLGICQDLAAVTVAMLRSVGIVSKLVIGYADKRYHAWTESVVEGKKRMFDPTVAVYGICKPMTYTAERVY